ncbi:MAG TPA: alpha/beta hydrolase, partial [Streptosporangiaceae bacterium]
EGAMSDSHEELDIPLPDGTLRVLRWGGGGRAAVALHGITASAMSWQAVARALSPDWTLYAPDLRGRGGSATLPGPYGLDRQVADVVTVARQLRLARPVLAGHSFGAYIALLAMAGHASAFGGLLLVDGGIPLPVPDGMDFDAALSATLGPALARLHQTFPTTEAYFGFWRAHPALKDSWNSDIEDYLRYDLTGPDGAKRSRVIEAAVRENGRDLLARGRDFGTALRELSASARLLRAPAGIFGQPPGLLPEELCRAWLEQAPNLTVETLAGANHYTLVLDPAHAATVAQRLTQLAESNSAR